MRTARRLGIPTLLDRPNAHTAFAYAEAEREARQVGVALPSRHDHQADAATLAHEEAEYREASFLLCPSDFVRRTFLERGFPAEKLLRHHYGCDLARFRPGTQDARENRGLVMLYAGVGEPRKGRHYALEAWLQSGALVTYEARASGCVLLVSDAAGAPCRDGQDALVHPARSVEILARHIARLDGNRDALARLRAESLRTVDELSWDSAAKTLKSCYRAATRSE